MLTRHAARVILVDSADRVLLLRGHDGDDPSRHWWFTVGGGIEPGEDERDAAVREVFEETGLRVARTDLEGPVLTRSAIFDFAREHCLQHETFFVVRLEGSLEPSRAGWTALETSFLDECAWRSRRSSAICCRPGTGRRSTWASRTSRPRSARASERSRRART